MDNFRIWSNNINSIGVSTDKPEFRGFCHDLAPFGIDIMALQETNLNTGLYSHRMTVKSILQQEFGTVKMITACTPLRSTTAYKPGGVLLAALGDCAHRVIATEAEPMGRWCSMTLTGKNQQLLKVYCVYQSVEHSDTSGIVSNQTYFAQQWEMLKTAGIPQPKPRQQLIADLSKDLQASANKSTRFIVLGDFNETIGKNPSLMASVCSQFNLVYIYQIAPSSALQASIVMDIVPMTWLRCTPPDPRRTVWGMLEVVTVVLSMRTRGTCEAGMKGISVTGCQPGWAGWDS
eukprot:scaffold24909_cov186-Cylindrotheca_fusiformis.AAC.1